MDESNSPIPEDVAIPADDEISADNSPSKAIANLKAQMAKSQPVDVSKLTPATESNQSGKSGLLGEIRERLKTATEIKPGETPTVVTNSKWFPKK